MNATTFYATVYGMLDTAPRDAWRIGSVGLWENVAVRPLRLFSIENFMDVLHIVPDEIAGMLELDEGLIVQILRGRWEVYPYMIYRLAKVFSEEARRQRLFEEGREWEYGDGLVKVMEAIYLSLQDSRVRSLDDAPDSAKMVS